MACSGTNSLSLTDSKCYASCPTGSSSITPFTGAPTPLCITCSDNNCATCDASGVCSVCGDGYKLTSDNKCASTAITKEKSGLSSKIVFKKKNL